jgi:hypothetical protein
MVWQPAQSKRRYRDDDRLAVPPPKDFRAMTRGALIGLVAFAIIFSGCSRDSVDGEAETRVDAPKTKKESSPFSKSFGHIAVGSCGCLKTSVVGGNEAQSGVAQIRVTYRAGAAYKDDVQRVRIFLTNGSQYTEELELTANVRPDLNFSSRLITLMPSEHAADLRAECLLCCYADGAPESLNVEADGVQVTHQAVPLPSPLITDAYARSAWMLQFLDRSPSQNDVPARRHVTAKVLLAGGRTLAAEADLVVPLLPALKAVPSVILLTEDDHVASEVRLFSRGQPLALPPADLVIDTKELPLVVSHKVYAGGDGGLRIRFSLDKLATWPSSFIHSHVTIRAGTDTDAPALTIPLTIISGK